MRKLLFIFLFLTKTCFAQDQTIELCDGNQQIYTYTSIGAPDCNWTWNVYYNNRIIQTSDKDYITVSFTRAGNYKIEAQIENELCQSENQYYQITAIDCRVPVLYFPSAFTPNKDGLNEEYKPAGVFIAEYHLQIYNKWGQVIFMTNSLTESWSGDDCPSDVYVYYCIYKDIHGNNYIKYGSITLFR